ncbi:MAG: hypothetical protein E7L01_26670 [Paenibacillus macerans]|uniref:Lipoprotein n=1 Tax=Paenibacillus macerans TaxID=44252 RepID=A0A6N8EV90_PAEMA|nr:hypothetical protein [Paenibacillus macerans]MDU7476898.1 hypothetical protein [Paenibacillus macerans]MUG22351.1 hypothetical protein [Paenibacillus macerans]UMV49115.1 hypothetical protein LMZ02_07080 [Paenibacillus macerans]
MKKEIGVMMLLSVVLLSGCSLDHSGNAKQGLSESPSNQVTTQPKQETTQDTTESGQENKNWSSENNEVKISPIKVNKYGTTEIVSVEVNGVKKEFNWDIAEEPRVFYTDVTGDSKPEAVIITNLGRGTETSIDEIHVLNSENLSEIKVPNDEEIVADYIESHITKNDEGNVTIKVKANEEDYEFTHALPDPDMEVQNHLFFGGVVTYSLENQKIFLRIPGGIVATGVPMYVCNFQITYKFDNVKNEFIVDKMKFETYEE